MTNQTKSVRPNRKSYKPHDPLQDIERQLESLNKSIRRNENNAEIVKSLRQQKHILGEMAKDYKAEQQIIKDAKDQGNAYRSKLHNSGNLGDVLLRNDRTVKSFTRQINKKDD
jgi:hypothetical protein